MPRRARRDAPGEIHHVWTRGLDRREIFRDDRDRWDLVERLARILPECGVACLAWAFLPNHLHLVLKRGPVSLSRVMARINTGYARAFNERHGCTGFLFENRFKSRIVEDDADLAAVFRYVVTNPIKHALVDPSGLEAYPWTLYSALMGRRPLHPFESRSEVCRLLGTSEDALERVLRDLVSGSPRSEEPSDRRASRPDEGPPPPSHDPEGISFDDLASLLCTQLGIDRRDLLVASKRPALVEARSALAWLGVRRLGLSGAEVARNLGWSSAAVSRHLARGGDVVQRLERFGVLEGAGESQNRKERPR